MISGQMYFFIHLPVLYRKIVLAIPRKGFKEWIYVIDENKKKTEKYRIQNENYMEGNKL